MIGRKPQSHYVFNDGLIVNDYSLLRAHSSTSLYSDNDGDYYSRSTSRGNRRRSGSRGARARSASASRRSLKPANSTSFEVRGRSRTPKKYSSLCNNCDLQKPDEGSFVFICVPNFYEKSA